MSLVSNTSTFLAFAPNNTNLVKKFEADSLVLIDYMYFKWPSGAILIMRDTFLPILNPLPRCHLVTLARQRAKKCHVTLWLYPLALFSDTVMTPIECHVLFEWPLAQNYF